MDLFIPFIVLGIISIILALGLYITYIVFSFCYETYELDKAGVITNINKTLNSQLIYDFNLRGVCREDEEKLILGVWDGTIDKCNCHGTIKDSKCGSSDNECSTIEGEKPINYTIFNGKEICVFRKGGTYFNLVKNGKIIKKEQNCSESDKSCGIVDTLERKLCVNKSEDCPINKNNIINKDGGNNHLNLIQFNENKIYYLNEETNEEKIISVIKLSDGYPCLNFSQKNWKAYYPDEKVKNEICSSINGQTTDNQYEKFDMFETNKYTLYKENGLSKYITQELIDDNSTLNLYGTTFIGIDIGEEGFNYEDLISSQDLSNNCNAVMLICSYILFGLLIFPFCVCVGSCANGGGGDCGKGLENFFAIFLILAAVILVIIFLMDFILCIIIFISVRKIKAVLINISKIGDEIVNILINELIEKYSSNYTFALTLIIMLVAMIFFGLLCLIMFFFLYKEDVKDNNKDDDKEKTEMAKNES